MGNITGYSQNNFKSAKYVFSKIKRDFRSFNSANLLDENDFPQYVADILKQIGNSAFKEERAVLIVKNGKAKLPKDFMQLHAAYKCCGDNNNNSRQHLQRKSVFENHIDCDIVKVKRGCEIECDNNNGLIQRVTIKEYVNDNDCNIQNYNRVSLLKLSPNVRQHCADDCLNFLCSAQDEITINNRAIFTNFDDGDIFMLYYAFPYDEDGIPMIPDNVEMEKLLEMYIKWQVLLNYWTVSDVPDILQRAQYYEAAYNKAHAEVNFNSKLPGFSTLTNDIRSRRGINKTAFFSQIDKFR